MLSTLKTFTVGFLFTIGAITIVAHVPVKDIALAMFKPAPELVPGYLPSVREYCEYKWKYGTVAYVACVQRYGYGR